MYSLLFRLQTFFLWPLREDKYIRGRGGGRGGGRSGWNRGCRGRRGEEGVLSYKEGGAPGKGGLGIVGVGRGQWWLKNQSV